MKLAHLILAHNNPSQLARLVKQLAYENTDIFIHLDKKTDITGFESLHNTPGVFFIKNRALVTWANYSVVTATLNSFEEILATKKIYSHINLLSGADYPLKDAGTIQKYLFANADKTFIKYRHVYNDWEESRSRFTLYSFGDYNFPLKYKLQKLWNRLKGERKLPNGLEPYGFSQWFTMTPVCARYTIDYLKKHKKVRQFFRMTWGVDELIFQTILVNSHLKDTIVNDHLRYIKFQKAACSPEILTMAFKADIMNSGKFYGRKFDPQIDSEILDYLDTVINTQKN